MRKQQCQGQDGATLLVLLRTWVAGEGGAGRLSASAWGPTQVVCHTATNQQRLSDSLNAMLLCEPLKGGLNRIMQELRKEIADSLESQSKETVGNCETVRSVVLLASNSQNKLTQIRGMWQGGWTADFKCGQ